MLRVPASFFVTVRCDLGGALCGAVDDMPFALNFRGPEQPVHRVSLLPDGRFQARIRRRQQQRRRKGGGW